MQLAIQFLNAKNVHLAEIHRQIVHVYGEGAVNEGNVRKCVSCSNVHEEVKKWVCKQFKWEIFKHAAYSPNLVPRDYQVFLHLKKFLAGQSVRNDRDQRQVGLSERLGDDLL